jgi:hypothetical protein
MTNLPISTPQPPQDAAFYAVSFGLWGGALSLFTPGLLRALRTDVAPPPTSPSPSEG